MSALDRLVESGLQPYRAGTIVGACEVAGLVVLDPDDPEVQDRIKGAIIKVAGDALFFGLGDATARAVLSALKANG